MQYTYTELAAYLLLYSFIGWTLEVAFFAVKERRFCNRGFFSLPLCPEYGIMMDILILLLPEQGTKWLLQFLTTWMVVSVVEYFSGGIAAKIWKKHLWNYEDVTLFGGKKKSVLLSLIKAAVVMTAVLLLHPPVFILFSMIPTIVLRIIDIVGFGLMAADLVSILIAVRKSRSLTELKETQGRLLQEQKEVKQKLGGKIYHAVWKRLNRAYPEMEALEEADRAERYVFARGVCVDKLIWVFMICAFLGDLIETLFCRVTGGVWMSRSSVIYGTFSIVWGFGAVILTVVLQRLAGKEDRYIFLAGSVLGGAGKLVSSQSALPGLGYAASVPVPALAQGAVIPPNRQFLAMLGDQTTGTNVEAPLETIKQAMAETLAGWQGSADGQPINIYIGEELLDSVIANSQNRRALRSGGR